jgi:hypothetical protein
MTERKAKADKAEADPSGMTERKAKTDETAEADSLSEW